MALDFGIYPTVNQSPIVFEAREMNDQRVTYMMWLKLLTPPVGELMNVRPLHYAESDGFTVARPDREIFSVREGTPDTLSVFIHKQTSYLTLRLDLADVSIYGTEKWLFFAVTADNDKQVHEQKLLVGDLNTPAKEWPYFVRTVGSGSFRTASTSSLHIGSLGNVGAGASSYSGSIAWVGMWDRWMTDEEIVQQQFNPFPSSGNVLFTHLGITDDARNYDLGPRQCSSSFRGLYPSRSAHVPIPIWPF